GDWSSDVCSADLKALLCVFDSMGITIPILLRRIFLLLILAVSNRKILRRRIGMVMPMESQTQSNAFPHEPPALSVVKAPRRSKRGWLIAGAILLVFAGLFVYRILARLRKAVNVMTETAQMAVPSVP